MKFMGLWSDPLSSFQTELGPATTVPIKLKDMASHYFTSRTLVLATILKSSH
jgi:hypothetical protein